MQEAETSRAAEDLGISEMLQVQSQHGKLRKQARQGL